MSEKKCSSCGMMKEYEQFHKDKAKSDGLRSECKECHIKMKLTICQKKQGNIGRRFGDISNIPQHIISQAKAKIMRSK